MWKTNAIFKAINNRINRSFEKDFTLLRSWPQTVGSLWWAEAHLESWWGLLNCPFYYTRPKIYIYVKLYRVSYIPDERGRHSYLHGSTPKTSVLSRHWKHGNYAWQKTINKSAFQSVAAAVSCGVIEERRSWSAVVAMSGTALSSLKERRPLHWITAILYTQYMLFVPWEYLEGT